MIEPEQFGSDTANSRRLNVAGIVDRHHRLALGAADDYSVMCFIAQHAGDQSDLSRRPSITGIYRMPSTGRT